MRKTKVLRPAKEDLVVINPQTGLKIKKEGEPLTMSTYWARRLKCGDVVEVKESKPAKSSSKKNESLKNDNKKSTAEE